MFSSAKIVIFMAFYVKVFKFFLKSAGDYAENVCFSLP